MKKSLALSATVLMGAAIVPITSMPAHAATDYIALQGESGITTGRYFFSNKEIIPGDSAGSYLKVTNNGPADGTLKVWIIKTTNMKNGQIDTTNDRFFQDAKAVWKGFPTTSDIGTKTFSDLALVNNINKGEFIGETKIAKGQTVDLGFGYRYGDAEKVIPEELLQNNNESRVGSYMVHLEITGQTPVIPPPPTPTTPPTTPPTTTPPTTTPPTPPPTNKPTNPPITNPTTQKLGLTIKPHVNDKNGNAKADLGESIKWEFTVVNNTGKEIKDLVINSSYLKSIGVKVKCDSITVSPGKTVKCWAVSNISQADANRGEIVLTGQAIGNNIESTNVESDLMISTVKINKLDNTPTNPNKPGGVDENPGEKGDTPGGLKPGENNWNNNNINKNKPNNNIPDNPGGTISSGELLNTPNGKMILAGTSLAVIACGLLLAALRRKKQEEAN